MRDVMAMAIVLIGSVLFCNYVSLPHRVERVYCWPVDADNPKQNAKYEGYTMQCDERKP